MIDPKLVKDFVEIANAKEENRSDELLYGTAKLVGEEYYVQLDGSEVLMPFESSIDVTDNDRVCVKIVNNKAYIDTNMSVPTTGYNYVYDDGYKLIKTDDAEAPANATQSAMNTAIGANTNAQEAKQAAQEAQQYAEEHGWSTKIGNNWIKTADVVAENLTVNNGNFNKSFSLFLNETVDLFTNYQRINCSPYSGFLIATHYSEPEEILTPPPETLGKIIMAADEIHIGSHFSVVFPDKEEYNEPLQIKTIQIGNRGIIGPTGHFTEGCKNMYIESKYILLDANDILFKLDGYKSVSLRDILTKLNLLIPEN